MRIYLTHCSKEKSPQAKVSGVNLPPDLLYTDLDLQQFVSACKSVGAAWAILSDHYGVFSPDETHPYYEKPPAAVTPEEEAILINQLNKRLEGFDEIWFYVRPAAFHPLYERILMRSALSERVHLFTNLVEVK
jgi:hypothetical protein